MHRENELYYHFFPKMLTNMATQNDNDFIKAFYVEIVITIVGFLFKIDPYEVKEKMGLKLS